MEGPVIKDAEGWDIWILPWSVGPGWGGGGGGRGGRIGALQENTEKISYWRIMTRKGQAEVLFIKSPGTDMNRRK